MSNNKENISQIISFEEIKNGFSFLNSPENIHEYLIELGKALPKMIEEFKTQNNKVLSCQSNVWIAKILDGNLTADSDSIMVKGILHILLAIITSPDFIKQMSNKQYFSIEKYINDSLEEIGLLATLSTFRKTGIASSIKKITELL